MGLLGRHATSIASAAANAPAGLAVEDDFETTYLQPLKVIDVILEKIADAWTILVYWEWIDQVTNPVLVVSHTCTLSHTCPSFLTGL
jgi:hypothetical protein